MNPVWIIVGGGALGGLGYYIYSKNASVTPPPAPVVGAPATAAQLAATAAADQIQTCAAANAVAAQAAADPVGAKAKYLAKYTTLSALCATFGVQANPFPANAT